MTGYTPEDVERQCRAWYEAAWALRNGDRERAVRMLLPPLPNNQMVPMTAASCTLGVELIAAELRRQLGARVHEPLDAEMVLVPGTEAAAVTRLAGDLVVRAVRNVPGTATLITDWLVPQHAQLDLIVKRSASLLAELLNILAETLTDSEDQR